MTRTGSLCSGYGGLEMGVQSVIGGTVAWHAEYDPDASKILTHHWPDTPNHGDITQVDWTSVEPVEVLTTGYPCQPFSHAGKREGEQDARHLWPHVGQAVRVLRPRLVVLENVAGHLSLGFGRVLGDLAAIGYDTQWVRLRAADVGAPHGRARVFVVAEDTDGAARGERRLAAPGQAEGRGTRADARGRGGAPAADAVGGELQRRGDGEVLAAAARTAEGPRDQRERDGHPTGDRRTAAADTTGDTGRISNGVDLLAGGQDTSWGQYAPAIERWERILGRAAPAPTEPGRTGQPRLSPTFVEFMMGLPAGHVTAVPGLSRNAQLRALGNGVVPQQATAALTWLLQRGDAAA